MSAFEHTSLLVLGAGYSTRFGSDKLSANLNGKPLAVHLLAAVAPFRFQQKLLVFRGQVWGSSYVHDGFMALTADGMTGSQSASLRLGLSEATAENVLILLADMPFISPDHLRMVEATFATNGGRPVASGSPAQPPAIFRRADLAGSRMEGDRGARDLLVSAIRVPAITEVLRDIDTIDDLDFYNASCRFTL